MKVPTCPEHGNLVLDLARGRLKDADAAEADLVRESCPDCAEWWTTTFSDRATADVDIAVARVFAEFSPPAGRRRHGWLAAAAAAVLAVGVAATTMMWRGTETAPEMAEQSVPAEAVLSTWDFEDGTVTATVEPVAAPTPGNRGETDEAVFVNDLETGDLGAWTLHS